MDIGFKEMPRHKTFGKRRSLRLTGFDYRSCHVYHLTWGTVERKPILTDSNLTMRLIELLKHTVSKAGICLYAFCFMPDHVHLLVCPEKGLDITRFVQGYKGRSTRTYWKLGGHGKLWQRGFYDHILRCEEDVKETARYILGNPVRKGLVENLVDYTFSGSCVFEKHDL